MTEPRATVREQYARIVLDVSGYPGEPDRVVLQYGPGDRIRASVQGPGAGNVREFDTDLNGMSDWPDWLPDLSLRHNPEKTPKDRANVFLGIAERREAQGKPRNAAAARRTAAGILGEASEEPRPQYTMMAGPR